MYFLGQKIDYFKPLRHCFNTNTLNQIHPSESLIEQGWHKQKLIDLISYKGFIDPNFPSQIRTPDLLISLDKFTVISIEPIHVGMNNEKENLPVFYKDFAQQRRLEVSPSMPKEVCVKWVEQDLLHHGNFIRKIDQKYIFETTNFQFVISEDMKLMNVSMKDESLIYGFSWSETGCEVMTQNGVVRLENEHVRWLSFFVRNYERMLPQMSLYDRIPMESFSGKEWVDWIIHPELWERLNIDDEEIKRNRTVVWIEDIRENGLVLSQRGRETTILGWRFRYVFDGMVLSDILTPDGKMVEKIVSEKDMLVVNNGYRTSLLKSSPEVMTDLVPGNKVSILPESILNGWSMHPHATHRYEQRIDEHSLPELILEDILHNVYMHSSVVEGAHNDERRKVETDRYGYVVTNDMVISVWDKIFNRKKARPRESNPRERHSSTKTDFEEMSL